MAAQRAMAANSRPKSVTLGTNSWKYLGEA